MGFSKKDRRNFKNKTQKIDAKKQDNVNKKKMVTSLDIDNFQKVESITDYNLHIEKIERLLGDVLSAYYERNALKERKRSFK